MLMTLQFQFILYNQDWTSSERVIFFTARQEKELNWKFYGEHTLPSQSQIDDSALLYQLNFFLSLSILLSPQYFHLDDPPPPLSFLFLLLECVDSTLDSHLTKSKFSKNDSIQGLSWIQPSFFSRNHNTILHHIASKGKLLIVNSHFTWR